MTQHRNDPPRRDTPGKKPYRKPSLAVHGDIRTVTKSKGGSANDGTGKPKTKSPTGTGT